ncbi:hypothetical protein F511_29066 [Dorcoceras hygrometricum]|uniref:Uncharacterized protein n=1 Tax=Dorcoceras hygrometricum TaxID=472368 RepID=A0A2Z7CX27_9LAMI|nr:hypothetical protein F511_29066 [Dorcoceras hygrometricum]
MSGRGRGRRDTMIDEDSTNSNTRVLASMTQLLEQLVGQSSQGNGQSSNRGLVTRILRKSLDFKGQRSFQEPVIHLQLRAGSREMPVRDYIRKFERGCYFVAMIEEMRRKRFVILLTVFRPTLKHDRYFQPFVPYLLNPRILFSRELSGDFPSFLVVVLLVRGFYQSLRDFSQGCEGERQYRTLVSLLGSLAAMRRVVNYHSSWARQQQVELFDASGNPGSTAGRGFNPAGGAPGGNPGSTAGRGFNPAGGAPGGG